MCTTEVNGRKILNVAPEALTLIAEHAMVDIAHLLRPGHLEVGDFWPDFKKI